MSVLYRLVSLFFMTCGLYAETEIFFDKSEKKYGLRENEEILIKPVYYHILPFTGKWTVARKAGGFDIIDKTGKIILETEEITEQAGSRIICRLEDDQYTFADLENGIKFAKTYPPLSFNSDSYLVYSETKKTLIGIDEKIVFQGYDNFDVRTVGDDLLIVAGKGDSFYLFDQNCDSILTGLTPAKKILWSPENPSCFVIRAKNGKEGIGNIKGKLIVKADYEKIFLTENIYAYSLKTENGRVCGAKTLEGKEILAPSPVHFLMTPFHQEGMVVLNKANSDIIIAENGIISAPPCRISGIDDFSSNILYGFSQEKRKVLTPKGKVIISGDYFRYSKVGQLIFAEGPKSSDVFTFQGRPLIRKIDYIRHTSSGYLTARGKYKGFISQDLSVVLPPVYSSVSKVSETVPHLIALQRGRLWGAYDLKLKARILPYKFFGISLLGSKALALRMSYGTTLTNLQGAILVKPASFSIEKYFGEYAVIKYLGKFGVVNSGGKVVIEPRLARDENLFEEELLILDDNSKGVDPYISKGDLRSVKMAIRKYFTGVDMEQINFESKSYVEINNRGVRKDLGNGDLRFICRNFFSVGRNLYSMNLKKQGEFSSFYRLNSRALTAEDENGGYYFFNSALVKSGPYHSIFYNRRDGSILYGQPNRKGILNNAGEVIIEKGYSRIILQGGRYFCFNTAGTYSVSSVYNSWGELIAGDLQGKAEYLNGDYFLLDSGNKKFLYKGRERIAELSDCIVEEGRIRFLKGANVKLDPLIKSESRKEKLETCPPCGRVNKFSSRLIRPEFKK